MKKIFALVLALAMVASFAACGAQDTASGDNNADAAAAEYKLGMGISVSLDSSKDKTAQADATVATVIMDKDGKIVAADLDCAQTKLTADADLTTVDLRTKKEKKEDYGMTVASPIGKEWYVQAAAFAEKMIGKTLADIEGMETEVKNNHNVAVDADIYAVCTMDITAFKEAFVAACKDDQAKTFKAAADSFKLGLAVNTDVSGSKAEEAQLYSTFSAVAVDADGKILAAIVDAIQPKVAFNADGTVGEKTYKATKRVLKEEYGMTVASPIGKEWYVQADAYTEKMVGKTAADIEAIATEVKNNHNVAVDADLYAVCTMDITAFKADMAEAIKAAK
ncbi:MAG: hypothetical protein IIX54_00010 [Clostridia bacterium]|nr:hypothetical protein [Clostridia bacterium]